MTAADYAASVKADAFWNRTYPSWITTPPTPVAHLSPAIAAEIAAVVPHLHRHENPIARFFRNIIRPFPTPKSTPLTLGDVAWS